MRLHRCMPVLAAVVSLAGVSAPLAQASDAIAPGGGGSLGESPTPVVQQHHPAGSVDWVIGIGSAAGLAILGAGATVTLRSRRPAAATTRTRVAS
jgi:hypothetical protein